MSKFDALSKYRMLCDETTRAENIARWHSLGLGSRAANFLALQNEVIETIDDIHKLGPNRLMGLPGVGRKTVIEIGRVLFNETWVPAKYKYPHPPR